MINRILIGVLALLMMSCEKDTNELSSTEKQEIANEVRALVDKVFEYSNNMDFESGLDHYSSAQNAFYISDGVMHTLADLKKAYKAIGPSVEALHNTIESRNIQVLSPEVVTIALPVTLTLKLKGIPEYTGKLVWTATLQKQEGHWVIVQSHESWLNCAEVAAALTNGNDI